MPYCVNKIGNLIIAVSILLLPTLASADRILLRNLKTISDRTVASFDVDGVKLDDGSVLTWDEIERCKVDDAKQSDVDRLLEELGDPLYRINQRLKVGDYEGLLEYAEAVYPRYASRQSPTAYMVTQALMWGRLADGKREAAVEPYLRAYEYLRTTRSDGSTLPGDRRLQFDAPSALSPTLNPVWFDAQSAKASLKGVFTAIRSMKRPLPEGVYIYYATMASAAGDAKMADSFLTHVQSKQPLVAQWRDVAKAQFEVLAGQPASAVSDLNSSLHRLSPQTKPAAVYWLGMSKIGDDNEKDRLEGVLQLIHLPATYGKRNPELAGAGLYQAMIALDKLDDAKGSIALRKELMIRYAHTVHAAKVKSEIVTRSSE